MTAEQAGRIYVLGEVEEPSGPVKIGMTTGPQSQTGRAGLSGGNWRQLEVLHTWPLPWAEVRWHEFLIHRNLRHRHVRGEWFDVRPLVADGWQELLVDAYTGRVAGSVPWELVAGDHGIEGVRNVGVATRRQFVVRCHCGIDFAGEPSTALPTVLVRFATRHLDLNRSAPLVRDITGWRMTRPSTHAVASSNSGGYKTKALALLGNALVSDIAARDNVVLGHYAEALVALALCGRLAPHRWESWDCEAADGGTVQVKTSTAMGIGKKADDAASPARWAGFKPVARWLVETNEFEETTAWHADIWVLSRVEGLDPFDDDAWAFFVLTREDVQTLGVRSTSLSALLDRGHESVKLSQLGMRYAEVRARQRG